jgi:hypothetical protein
MRSKTQSLLKMLQRIRVSNHTAIHCHVAKQHNNSARVPKGGFNAIKEGLRIQ